MNFHSPAGGPTSWDAPSDPLKCPTSSTEGDEGIRVFSQACATSYPACGLSLVQINRCIVSRSPRSRGTQIRTQRAGPVLLQSGSRHRGAHLSVSGPTTVLLKRRSHAPQAVGNRRFALLTAQPGAGKPPGCLWPARRPWLIGRRLIVLEPLGWPPAPPPPAHVRGASADRW